MRRPETPLEVFARDTMNSRATDAAHSLSPRHAHISFTALVLERPLRALEGSAAPTSHARADANSPDASAGHAPSSAHHGEEALLAVQLIIAKSA